MSSRLISVVVLRAAYAPYSQIQSILPNVVAYNSTQRWMFSAASVCLSVCLFVCQHDNFRTSKHRMMKLGVCIVQKFRASSNLGIIAPGYVPPKM